MMFVWQTVTELGGKKKVLLKTLIVFDVLIIRARSKFWT